MATFLEQQDAKINPTVRDKAGQMVSDVRGEVQREAHDMRDSVQPVNPSHDDHPVRRHVNGLTMTFFVAIVIFLVAVIAGVMLFGPH